MQIVCITTIFWPSLAYQGFCTEEPQSSPSGSLLHSFSTNFLLTQKNNTAQTRLVLISSRSDSEATTAESNQVQNIWRTTMKLEPVISRFPVVKYKSINKEVNKQISNGRNDYYVSI